MKTIYIQGSFYNFLSSTGWTSSTRYLWRDNNNRPWLWYD